MKKRLFDFSASSAFIVCAAYALLISFAAYILTHGGNKILLAVILIMLVVSFAMVFVFFVVLSPKITKKGISHGAKNIKMKNIRYKAIYDRRLKEKAVIFWDKHTDIKYVDPKDYGKKTIRVQATAVNVKKIEEWLGCTLTVPEKPPRRKFFGRRR